VCTGLKVPRKPNRGDIPGFGNFTGISIHSSAYRVRSVFRRKSVLVSGGGRSGQDIAGDLKLDPTIRVIHSSAGYPTSQRGRIKSIETETNGTFTIYFNRKADRSTDPVSNIDVIIWCWGFTVDVMPVNGSLPYSVFNDVLYQNFPGVARVGTTYDFSSARTQAPYVGRLLAGRIPVPDTNTSQWQQKSTWNILGHVSYLWHELTSY